MLTNIQLARFCQKVLDAKWVYWYGTYGYQCTKSRYEAKAKQYPAHYTDSRKAAYMRDIAEGRTCADCVGLIKAFFWKGGDVNAAPKYKSNNCPDKGANSMFALCKETGEISTIPDVPGLVVWKSGHIGVYVGDGYTVEMKGFDYDCVKAKVTDGAWTKWGKLPATMLSYAGDEPGKKPEPPSENTVSGTDGKTVIVRSESGRVNLRRGNGTEYGRVAQLAPGTTLPYVATAANGWHAARYGNQVAWISGQYSEVRG